MKLPSFARSAILALVGLIAISLAIYALETAPAGTTSRLSWELSDAPPGPNAPWRVYFWLLKNRQNIERAEARFHVDRRAIAGVIAYEALIDVNPGFIKPFARYAGPGKVHFKDGRFLEGQPASKDVEEFGYLPKRTMAQRKALLSTDVGSIEYISAIVAVYADAAERSGHNIRCRPDLLSTFYSAWPIPNSMRFFARWPRRALRANIVGIWVESEREFLQNAVGTPTPSVCERRRSFAALWHRKVKTVSKFP